TTRVVPFEFELLQKRFLYVGPQAEELLGYPLRRWYSLNFWETTVARADVARVESAFADAVVGQKTDFECEFRMVNSDGDPIWIRQIVRLESRSETDYQSRGFLIDISAAKSLEAALEESHRELRELSQRYDQDRERERVAVSREIHDELGQVLTLFRLDLSWIMRRLSAPKDAAVDEQIMAKLGQMETQIETTLQIVRRITTRLRPPILDEFGLAEAIRWQASEFSRRAGIRCDVHIEPVECHSRDTSTAVFRIFQEILTNVARHARARRVDIRLSQVGVEMKLTVSDNGCGFATDQVRGFGLLGMRERTEALGGTLEVQSEPGHGTCVTLRVDCAPSPAIPLPT
ncbi:MAG: ATP-binding protein, partial [Chthoniobacteraceae bacterium]